MIRRATIADTLHVATLGHKFIEAAQMPAATIEHCIDFCARALSSDQCGCFVSDGGVILGVLSGLYYRPDYLQVSELFWWAEDGMGKALLAALEDWGREMGAKEINMSTLDYFTHKKIETLLEVRGYELREKTFRKNLGA